MSVVVPCGFALTGCWIATFCDCSPCTVQGGGRSANGGGFNPYSFPTSDGPTATCGSCGNDPNSVGGGSTWGGSQPTSAFTNVTQVINALKQDQFPAEEVDDLSFSTAKLLYTSWSKYKSANFTSAEFRSLKANESLFGEINQAAAEEYGMDATFREDALLYQKLLNESTEFANAANTLNTLSTSGTGGGGNPVTEILADLLIEGAQEVAGDFIGLGDIQAIQDMVQKGADKGLKLAYKVFRRSVRFLAGKNPVVRALLTIEKVNSVFQKYSEVKKVVEKLNTFNDKILDKFAKTLKDIGNKSILKSVSFEQPIDNKYAAIVWVDLGGSNSNDFKDKFFDRLKTIGGRLGNNSNQFVIDDLDLTFQYYLDSTSGQTAYTVEIIYNSIKTSPRSRIKIRLR